MNAVEIEEAVSDLARLPFEAGEFPFQFITAFGAKKATVDRLRAMKGGTNQSDIGGVLQRNNIHIGVAPAGQVGATLAALRDSPKTASAKAKFILATDGETVEAEDLIGGDVVACAFADLPRHFATFLPLAGISTVKEIKNNPIDVKATGRLNKLYVELLKDNPHWATEERRHELNQFMARLIFCFFAEDTGIFRENQFTATITQMSQAGHGSGEEQWGNTHTVLTELFRVMDTPVTHEGNLDPRHRIAAGIRPYADVFPYVNGGLFTGATDSPRFSRTARAYLLRAGELDWKEINPDIFGSMIQAVADDGERGELGMHYTSVPNILKVLNPLFLDDLRATLEAAGGSRQKLRNLRKRLGNIRVFDPACGSGNFLVIAYREMRAVEAAIVAKLGGEESLKLADRRSVIPLSNFYGIEIKGFAAEIARLALLIAEFQADCLYLSQQEARAMVLPLHKTGQITVGNALRLDWLDICAPPDASDGLAEPGETYICGNPPYRGSKWQDDAQKKDLARAWSEHPQLAKTTDFVSGWIAAYLRYARFVPDAMATFVTTNSLCQGQQASEIWPIVTAQGQEIRFAYAPFTWKNLASHNAGVTVIIIGLGAQSSAPKRLFGDDGRVRECEVIGPYLVPNMPDAVVKANRPLGPQSVMLFGNMPRDGGHLFLTSEEAHDLSLDPAAAPYVRRFLGSEELIRGKLRYCLWIEDGEAEAARRHPFIAGRLAQVAENRRASPAESTRAFADLSHRFVQIAGSAIASVIVVPRVSSENRDYLPVDLETRDCIIGDRNFALYDAPLWNLALIASRLHWVWIGTVCVRMRTDFSYSNTLGWNTFPVPDLTQRQREDLTRSAENILLARQRHFPGTIAELYEANAMPAELREAHCQNDETVERIYFGRQSRNDTDRLESTFMLYRRMTTR